MIVSLTGFMCAGKSTVAREIAKMLDCKVVDLDEEIVNKERKTIPKIFLDGGEEKFRKIELETLKEVIEKLENEELAVLSLGGGTIMNEEARGLVFVNTKCVFLKASYETVMKRLCAEKNSRPLARKTKELFEARKEIYKLSPHVVDIDGLSPQEVALRIVEAVGVDK